ncbi:adenylate kinase family enzyme [Deinococcus metalli]|uniref:Adenylate kinase family enzyme n=1 Tax=Deinococcus metalli TaxID=1141878 RepID=A0A7W8KIS0_9DEIO|nr:adenylate kinase [Deinococcus metalli]MBB5378956.1 adenylate kinase family enzyme [Deinococcus metalli]GHF62998.1 hypothetical protein GCM10017781_43830 [Deinococcus metalli]
MRRILVVGTTGSGKTSFARALAARLRVPHGEQDAWNHQPGWQPAAPEEFRAQVAAFTAHRAWVMDGNYGKARDIGWARADTVVWLDYPGPVVFWRVLTRTLRRVTTREVLWNGNRETLLTAVRPDSPVPWFFRTHWRRRREMPGLVAAYPHLTLVHLRTPAHARSWLASLPE